MEHYPGLEVQDREKVEIFISCRSLKDGDTASKPHPFVVIQLMNPNSKEWNELSRTETIMDSINPNFSKSSIMDYIFEKQQNMRFQVFDYDSSSKSTQLLGECVTTLAKIVGSQNSTKIFDILNNKGTNGGKIILRAEKVNACNDEVILRIQGIKIKDMRFWIKSSPFLIFYRTTENKQPLKVYQTQEMKNDLNPLFPAIHLKSQKLCNGDYSSPIIVECWDHHENGQHQYIGQASFTLDEIFSSQTKQISLLHKKNNSPVGLLRFLEAKLIEKGNFLDYIRGGTHLNLVCAVDFTGSNGLPSSPESLHALHPSGKMNQYQQAIHNVGEILLNYDEDKQVPLYGFGAKPKLPHFNTTQTLHCFPLNGYPQKPEVFELRGLMEVYNMFLKHVELSGPTLFNPIIQETIKQAQQSKIQKDNNYYILLILTDGEIHDMDQTTQSIVSASHLPLSIIIIGIGNSDFTNMDILDGDDGLVDSTGKIAQRDLVQFVPFNKFKNDPIALASSVLEELPDQVIQYYTLIGQKPIQPSYQRMQSIQDPGVANENVNLGMYFSNHGLSHQVKQQNIQQIENGNQPQYPAFHNNFPQQQQYNNAPSNNPQQPIIYQNFGSPSPPPPPPPPY